MVKTKKLVPNLPALSSGTSSGGVSLDLSSHIPPNFNNPSHRPLLFSNYNLEILDPFTAAMGNVSLDNNCFSSKWSSVRQDPFALKYRPNSFGTNSSNPMANPSMYGPPNPLNFGRRKSDWFSGLEVQSELSNLFPDLMTEFHSRTEFKEQISAAVSNFASGILSKKYGKSIQTWNNPNAVENLTQNASQNPTLPEPNSGSNDFCLPSITESAPQKVNPEPEPAPTEMSSEAEESPKGRRARCDGGKCRLARNSRSTSSKAKATKRGRSQAKKSKSRRSSTRKSSRRTNKSRKSSRRSTKSRKPARQNRKRKYSK